MRRCHGIGGGCKQFARAQCHKLRREGRSDNAGSGWAKRATPDDNPSPPELVAVSNYSGRRVVVRRTR
jgi:hypothetical protein